MDEPLTNLWVLRDIGPEWEIDHPASPSEIIEAARNLSGAREVVVRQNALGESVIHMAGNPLADAAINLRSGHHVVIFVADARRTEEEK